ncbi:hypothetical protein [Moorena sp. SIOASIH]|nr:hypothetical protein [Moorena sp. SIOASIH]
MLTCNLNYLAFLIAIKYTKFFPTSYSLFPTPYSLFPIPCSLY